MAILRGLLAAALLMPAAQAQQAPLLDAPACPIVYSIYRLKGAPEFTAGFGQRAHPMATSDLMFWVRTPKRVYWFEFQSPNGYGGTWITPSVRPQLHDAEDKREDGEPPQAIKDWKESSAAAAEANDPLQDITFDAFKPDLESFASPPQSSDAAPARIFMRGLGQALWYSATWAAAGDRTAEQESVPTAMWEPAGCAR
ncbi:hypothetical protein [Sphingomonas sp.]|jgi:hypothetical protein|uniref:hypothetical protein n=1 Tax=Sphingomonas sp. TaxID=28214 RepID=UPI002ED80C89